MTVGGDPDHVGAGAASLRRAAAAIGSMPAQLTGASNGSASSCGQPPLALAAERFGACWSHRVAAIATQTYAAAELANNAAADLATAGGHGPR